MNRYITFVLLLVASLVACGSDDSTNSPTVEVPQSTANVTLQPTLDYKTIPVLGEELPPPAIPLAVNDSRYPIQPVAGDALGGGKMLYDRFCAACHGVDGEGAYPDPYAVGAAPPHDDTGHTWHHADQQNFATVWNGRSFNGAMPGYYNRMAPDEIISVLAYIKTWWTEEQLISQLDVTQRMIEGVSGAGGEG